MRNLTIGPPTNPVSQPRPLSTPLSTWGTDNKFLNGPFEPWRGESNAYDLEVVSGRIPDDLNGALFRISSNPRFEPLDPERYHWWEGDGAVAGVYLREGRGRFAMKWVETDSMKFELQQGRAVYPGFVNGSAPHPRPVGGPPMKNVANTNVGIFDDRLLVYFEGGLPTSLHPESLETCGPYDFHGGIEVLCTAHHKIDPATGDMLFFAAVGPQLTWYRAEAGTGEVVDSHTLDMGCPAMVHDFTVSENHAIFLISPTQFRLDMIVQGRAGVLWDEAAVPDGARFVVLDRRTKEVTWFDTGLMVAPTHFFNAFETPGGLVVVDVHIINRLGNPADDPDDPVSSHTWFPPAMAWRFELDPATKKADGGMLSGVAGEFPKINDSWLGRQNRWGYFATTRELSRLTMTDGMARLDHTTGQTTVLEGPDGLTNPSEPVFVQRHGATEENDGYLLSLWWNPSTGLSELLIHHGGAWESTPLARVRLPVRVPFGFHGSWADQHTLDAAVAARSKRRVEGSEA